MYNCVYAICIGLRTAEIEYWQELDAEFDADFPDTDEEHVNSPAATSDAEQRAITWWLVAFTCVFQTLHALPSRAIQWLIIFISALLTVFSRYSPRIVQIAHDFPTSLYQRSKFLEQKLLVGPIHTYIVCCVCHHLYDFKECMEKRGSNVAIRCCNHCQLVPRRKQVPLLKQVVSTSGNTRYYPYLAEAAEPWGQWGQMPP